MCQKYASTLNTYYEYMCVIVGVMEYTTSEPCMFSHLIQLHSYLGIGREIAS